ncbi:MAG: hypothetical protein SW833_27930 [Cyanobacteriota bacterium]|nr:hypothetical protein [Cyanobacteriota bacterium]
MRLCVYFRPPTYNIPNSYRSLTLRNQPRSRALNIVASQGRSVALVHELAARSRWASRAAVCFGLENHI